MDIFPRKRGLVNQVSIQVKKKEEKGKEPKDLGRSSRPGESIKYIPDMSKRRRKRRNGWTAAAESIVV